MPSGGNEAGRKGERKGEREGGRDKRPYASRAISPLTEWQEGMRERERFGGREGGKRVRQKAILVESGDQWKASARWNSSKTTSLTRKRMGHWRRR